ncbi:MAG: hypothetical protein IJ619_09650 [Eubacterium sp.]|nr:hypothetical protein [Eubacterium sp.]MCR5291919.1 hypothetical protein [Eubacterium sp.]
MENDGGREKLILAKMRNMLVTAANAPFTSDKVIVNKEEMLGLIDSLADVVDTELKTYREVTDKRARILSEAKAEAEEIRYEAQKSASRIRVTKRRQDEEFPFKKSDLTEEEIKALRTANDIYGASLIYTDEMLTEVDHLINNAYDNIEREFDRVQATLKAKVRSISENKNELMNNLLDLSNNDRYSQILELATLLSNELYHEREKAILAERERQGQMEFKVTDQDGELSVVAGKKRRPPVNPDRTAKKLSREEIKTTSVTKPEADNRKLVSRKDGGEVRLTLNTDDTVVRRERKKPETEEDMVVLMDKDGRTRNEDESEE